MPKHVKPKVMKSIFKSRTFWLAAIQAVLGVVIVVFTELDMVGYVAAAKSIMDVLLRLDTKEKVMLK
jgi:cellulase/cellobiase CelA1